MNAPTLSQLAAALDPDALIDAAKVELVKAKMPEAQVTGLATGEPASLLTFAKLINGHDDYQAKVLARNQCIAALHLRHGLSPVEIEKALARYAAGAWQRGDDRTSTVCPAGYAGTDRELLWAALRCYPQPIKKRSIEDFLAVQKSPPWFLHR